MQMAIRKVSTAAFLVFVLATFVAAQRPTTITNDVRLRATASTLNATIHVHSNMTGLENALLHVSNEEARSSLERNLERWKNLTQARYETLEAVKVGAATHIQAHKKARLVFWSVNIEDEYVVNESGITIAVHRNFWSKIMPWKTR